MSRPFKLKYKNSAFPFKSPLKHPYEEEHAHSEDTLRGPEQDFITVSGKRGTTTGHDNPHSSTQGTYSDLLGKAKDAQFKKDFPKAYEKMMRQRSKQ